MNCEAVSVVCYVAQPIGAREAAKDGKPETQNGLRTELSHVLQRYLLSHCDAHPMITYPNLRMIMSRYRDILMRAMRFEFTQYPKC